MNARRGNRPTLTVYRWQDIPAHVSARLGDEVVRVSLPERFHVAIDRAAMGAGAAGTGEYQRHWRREDRACSSDLRSEVVAEVDALDAAVSDGDLELMVRSAREARRVSGATS